MHCVKHYQLTLIPSIKTVYYIFWFTLGQTKIIKPNNFSIFHFYETNFLNTWS